MGGDEQKSHVAWVLTLFDATVLRLPWLFLLIVAGFAAFFGYYTKNFKLDASSESIVLENDRDLRYYSYTRDLFGSDDYIIAMVSPSDGLFTEKNLKAIEALSAEFAAMPDVESVTNILNVPLFHSPPVQFFEMATGYKTLATGADIEMAKQELTTSPLYRNYLISEDGKTSAVQVTFKDPSPEYQTLYNKRRELRDKRRDEGLSEAEHAELARVDAEFSVLYDAQNVQNDRNIAKVREIVRKYKPELGTINFGGVPMIIADIIAYVRSDIETFGVGVGILVLLVLGILFRKVKWIVLPAVCCGLSVLFVMGYLGFTNWSATIVTSNFPSILVVITLAMAIHVVVRFRELYARNPDWSNRDLIKETFRELAIPCLYTSLTTMVGFGSLVVSGIRPVMDFGLMMTLGIGISYGLIFILFPAALSYFPKGAVPPPRFAELSESPMKIFARITEKAGIPILVASVIVAGVGAYGIRLLKVENRFIDYFRTSTEIYQGMTVIDQRLGGTTPLEVVLETDQPDFWLEVENREKLREVHDWLDELPETGKVISPDTMLRMAESVYGAGTIPTPILKVLLSRIPKDIQDAVAKPYLTADRSQARLAMRVQETSKELSRKALMAKIHNYFDTNEMFKDGTIKPHITGVFVLYNNMLQSLFDSQIKTIAIVYAAIWLMFLVLFRSVKIATIAIIPNLLPVVIILGAMGFVGIPLDLMTIMTASITLGLAVDFAIHYVHRFQEEFPKDRNYTATMYRCHNSIGQAIYYTTLTTIAGFSILLLSNFIPSLYFGIFTSIALLSAFFASLTLLPLLILLWKPLGPERAA